MLRAFVRRTWVWLLKRLHPQASFSVLYVEGDELPQAIPKRTLVVAREDRELWSAGMACPCGCGRRIELLLLPDVTPRWDLRVGKDGRPTLSPSIWVAAGCRSHFWLRDGEIHWCED